MAVVLCFLLVAISCKKSAQPPAANAVTGNWNFVSANVQAKVLVLQTGDTSISYPGYLSQHNSGTISFTVDSMSVNGLGYAVDTSFKTYFYANGAIFDSASTPLTGMLQPTSTGTTYRMVNTDSLYFANAGVFYPAGVTAPSQGQGASFVVSGDTLRIISQINDTTSGGITIGKGTITLVRQH